MPTDQHAHAKARHAWALGGAFLAGALIALQSRFNGTLAAHSERPVVAALWSFVSGLAILTVIVLVVPAVRRGLLSIPIAVRSGRLKWWQCIGGVAGGLFVAVQTWSVPTVGVAIFSVAVVGGQTLNSLAVDRIGLGPAGGQPVTMARVAAALIAVVGVGISATAHSGEGGFSLWPVILTFVVGGLMAAQQAVNGRVNGVTGQVMATTWQNFAAGLVLLAGVAIVQAFSQAGAWSMPTGAPWWAWLGGPCGIGFIGIAAWAVHETGVLLFGLISVSGQLLAALVLDLVNSATRDEVGVQLLVGLLITLTAAVGAGVVATRKRARTGMPDAAEESVA